MDTVENDSLPTSSFENGRTMTYVVDERCIKCKTHRLRRGVPRQSSIKARALRAVTGVT